MLLETADEQGLEFALCVTSLRSPRGGAGGRRPDMRAFMMGQQRGDGGSSISDPVRVFKVYVEDGRREPERRCEFGSV